MIGSTQAQDRAKGHRKGIERASKGGLRWERARAFQTLQKQPGKIEAVSEAENDRAIRSLQHATVPWLTVA